ncbi:dipicolinate synthase subunit DpsA [Pelotomaculum terephthalicicum JT]|uniref:dipicolinate synthase subunit DpsA n=1 Tax=Pelotomaculum TaxID=191373 RepID=UPI0009CCA3A4|nr:MULTISPECIES: dipicolinate synthase subunit DpsA [Pelotomaculum]MCG9967748.1 dipicolinate synthase subunit DpsA [Pelotomaculum terephthalicicum JT]OPX85366.1 MAG: Dipicolinate synthase subunit A [Pelotomaculum sp. PtaB.Bin117]OPY62701.1 MAG: Dipicolinate synthase subunit A [Pelotomaculum sp. PtaU1.Bin065]
MQPDLDGITVAVIGGDARYLDMIEELLASGIRVNVTGLPVKDGTSGVVLSSSLVDSLKGVKAVVLPILGIDDKGLLHCVLSEQTFTLTEEIMAALPVKTLVFTGLAGTLLKQMTASLGLRLIELMNLDEVAILNSIPSSEGVVQMAMEMLPITIHGSSAIVIGFGRTGRTLSRLLWAMGARTGVVARKTADMARIIEMNLTPVSFTEMRSFMGEVDIIFNTVPAPVLTEDILTGIKPGTVIIDLATAPGGTDFQAAERLGLRAVLTPSLPGRVAPKTAGRILAKAITGFLAGETAGGLPGF